MYTKNVFQVLHSTFYIFIFDWTQNKLLKERLLCGVSGQKQFVATDSESIIQINVSLSGMNLFE